MDIAITVTAAPASEDLLLDAAAALQRDFGGALEFRWLAPGEAMDLISAEGEAPSPCPSPHRGEGTPEASFPCRKGRSRLPLPSGRGLG